MTSWTRKIKPGTPATILTPDEAVAAVVVRENRLSLTVQRVACRDVEDADLPVLVADGILTMPIGPPERFSRDGDSDRFCGVAVGYSRTVRVRSIDILDLLA